MLLQRHLSHDRCCKGTSLTIAAAKAPLSRSRGRVQVRSHAQKYFLGLSKAAKLKLKPGARDNRTTESVASKSAGAHMELETATEDSLKKCPVAATAATDATTVVAATVAAANP